jgi:antibiotic biosynthesis monooxygenase (ABM) superfamily enzyme
VLSGQPSRHSRREPTVIVSRRARAGRERDLERWLRRLVARASDAPGYVDAELQPPNDLHPDEWVVIYRFADSAALDTWMRSPARATLMATGVDFIEGDAREQVVALTPDSARVTAVSSVRVAPGEMEAFLDLHGEILVELATAPGFLRADLFEPVPGVQDDTVVVLAFDTREHLDHWLDSDGRRRILAEMERHTIGERTVNVVGGFAGWFAPSGGGNVARWKSAAAVLLARIPVSLLYTAVRLWLFPDLHAAIATVIGNVVGIVALTWLLMPVVTRRLDGWLRR